MTIQAGVKPPAVDFLEIIENSIVVSSTSSASFEHLANDQQNYRRHVPDRPSDVDNNLSKV